MDGVNFDLIDRSLCQSNLKTAFVYAHMTQYISMPKAQVHCSRHLLFKHKVRKRLCRKYTGRP
jgi:hypothetical protein